MCIESATIVVKDDSHLDGDVLFRNLTRMSRADICSVLIESTEPKRLKRNARLRQAGPAKI